MTDQEIHELAIAYAQAKLLKAQSSNDYDLDGYSEEVQSYLKNYKFAVQEIFNDDLD